MNSTKSFETNCLEDLPQTVTALLAELKHPLVLLIGDLGAGKTTLVKEILRQLGSQDSGSSPSYSLINEYKVNQGKLYHLDLYRLNTVEEAFALGLEDILYSGNTCLVEWPQLIMAYLERPYMVIKITVGVGEIRTIELSRVE